MLREDIRLAIRDINNLPTLPTVVVRIIEVAQDRGANAKQLAEIVSNDQSVFARILKLANSAFYGFSRQITNITQAVVVLGFDTVKSLALSISAFDSLAKFSHQTNFDREAFWVHSIGCGMVAKTIGKEIGLRESGTLFVAGLLHDLGKVILDTYFREQYDVAVQEMIQAGRSTADVEIEMLNIDHAEVGGWLAARWKFPEILVSPIAYHHNPGAANEAHLQSTLIIHLANILTKRLDIGLCYESTVPEPSDLVEAHLNLREEDLERLMGELGGIKEEIDEFFQYLNG